MSAKIISIYSVNILKRTWKKAKKKWDTGLQNRHLEKNSRAKKTHNFRKKLNNSAEKLKDLTKFTQKRKKLKYFCC